MLHYDKTTYMRGLWCYFHGRQYAGNIASLHGAHNSTGSNNCQRANYLCKGNNVELVVATAGLNYQWKKEIPTFPGANFQNYLANKTGAYKCLVSNNCGSITSNAIAVTVNQLPAVAVSQDPLFRCGCFAARGSKPCNRYNLSMEKGSKLIPGATGATYSALTSGTYRCVVTIAATGCSATSAPSVVTISCLYAKGY